MLLEDEASAKYMVIEKDLMLVYSINEHTSVNIVSDIVEVRISSLLSDKENSRDSITVWGLGKILFIVIVSFSL